MINSKDPAYMILIPAEMKDAGFLPQDTLVRGCSVTSTDCRDTREYSEQEIDTLLSLLEDL